MCDCTVAALQICSSLVLFCVMTKTRRKEKVWGLDRVMEKSVVVAVVELGEEGGWESVEHKHACGRECPGWTLRTQRGKVEEVLFGSFAGFGMEEDVGVGDEIVFADEMPQRARFKFHTMYYRDNRRKSGYIPHLVCSDLSPWEGEGGRAIVFLGRGGFSGAAVFDRVLIAGVQDVDIIRSAASSAPVSSSSSSLPPPPPSSSLPPPPSSSSASD